MQIFVKQLPKKRPERYPYSKRCAVKKMWVDDEGCDNGERNITFVSDVTGVYRRVTIPARTKKPFNRPSVVRKEFVYQTYQDKSSFDHEADFVSWAMAEQDASFVKNREQGMAGYTEFYENIITGEFSTFTRDFIKDRIVGRKSWGSFAEYCKEYWG